MAGSRAERRPHVFDVRRGSRAAHRARRVSPRAHALPDGHVNLHRLPAARRARWRAPSCVPPRSRRPRARRTLALGVLLGSQPSRSRLDDAPRGWSDFADAVRREVEITFNPRTRGAKIAGRCPDTQEQPTEVSRADEERQFEDVDEGFDLQSFTAQLEAQLEAQNAAASTVDAAEEKVNAELVQRLAEVADGYSAAGAAGELAAIDPDAVFFPQAVIISWPNPNDRWNSSTPTTAPITSARAFTGRELALLCYGKYGKYHDMAVKHVRMGEGMKRWVSLNLYVGHLGQRSYPATEEAYVAQLDSIAYMITGWGQADYCRAFFREPPIARRGLPSRPRVDTCVTLQFNRSPTWDDELGDEYFTY